MLILTLLLLAGYAAAGADAPAGPPAGADWPALAAQTTNLFQNMEALGTPVDDETVQEVYAAIAARGPDAPARAQQLLDARSLFLLQIGADGRITTTAGPVAPELAEGGWRHFLVKIENNAGSKSALRVNSPAALPWGNVTPAEMAERWLDLQLYGPQPGLTGAKLEYRIIGLYCVGAGPRTTAFSFRLDPAPAAADGTNELKIAFRSLPSPSITLRLIDEDSQPTTAALIIADRVGRIYPPPNKRRAPDLAAQTQIYRADGEHVRLPAGVYSVQCWRGPESRRLTRMMVVTQSGDIFDASIRRWADPSEYGWWSGDAGFHSTGGPLSAQSTGGLTPAEVIRHLMGEDVKIGSDLNWRPGFAAQQRYFSGTDDPVSHYPYLLHYEAEATRPGAGSDAGFSLLRLKQPCPTNDLGEPQWSADSLTTLRWAKGQDAISGVARAGQGLILADSAVPSYAPPADIGGAGESVVDATCQLPGADGQAANAIDFLSVMDAPPASALTLWYHLLNCGFRPRVAGGSGFPDHDAGQIGRDRTYVKVDGALTYNAWCEGLRDGRSYISDGMSHLMEFSINNVPLGQNHSEVPLDQPGLVHVAVKATAWLDASPRPVPDQERRSPSDWRLEWARIGSTREVPFELLVNGAPAFHTNLVADGRLYSLAFEVEVPHSSWIAARILPSSHTNPMWVQIAGQPLRPDRRSAAWCLQVVEQSWARLQPTLQPEEAAAAKRAYDHARQVYARLQSEN